MSELTTIRRDDAAPVARPASDATAIIQVIERAALNPDMDPDRMLKLLEVQERIMAKQAERDFHDAMSACQEEMAPVSRDASNSQTRSKYASYEALDRALRPVYTRHGFSLSFSTSDVAPEGYIRVVCKVARGGHSERPHLDMPADGKGAKGGDVMTKTHATMAAVSYARRGLLKMIFNIAEGDDDGNYGGKQGIAPSDDVQNLRKTIRDLDADEAKICQFLKVETLDGISARDCQRAIVALNDWVRQQRGGGK